MRNERLGMDGDGEGIDGGTDERRYPAPTNRKLPTAKSSAFNLCRQEMNDGMYCTKKEN